MKNMAYRISDPADLSGRGAAASAAAGIHARDDCIFLCDGKNRTVVCARVFRAGADVRRAAHSAAPAQAHRRVAGDPGGTGAHVLHRRARAAAHTAHAGVSDVSRKRQAVCTEKQRPLHSQWALPAYQKPRSLSPPARRKKVQSFSQATCAAEKILLGLQTCAPFAFGGRRVRCSQAAHPFVKKESFLTVTTAPIAFAMGAAAFGGDFLCLAQACVSPR